MATAVCREAFGGSLKSDKIRTFILLVNSIYWFFNLDEDEESSMSDSEGEQELIDVIRQTDPEFARLAEQHTELDKKIQQMETRVHLTAGEAMEIKQLKKWKLKAKDEITQILKKHQTQSSNPAG